METKAYIYACDSIFNHVRSTKSLNLQSWLLKKELTIYKDE